VLAIGLVPDRRYVNPCVPGIQDRLKLGAAFVKKTIAHAKTVFFQLH
jgi:hypothetical protein